MSILNVEMNFQNDANAKDIRSYLKALLYTLWNEGEGFSGKRPFGDSGWDYELYKALIINGNVNGKLDSDGYIDTVDKTEADKLIFKAIEEL